MANNIVVIDNYDSFVFNLVRYVQELGNETTVVRNDEISVAEISEWRPSAVILSPGPCRPEDAGVSIEVVQRLHRSVPILGVCLGHQAIAASFGGSVVKASLPMHGRTSVIHHSGERLFANCQQPLTVGRYHSLIVDEATLPDDLKVTSRTVEGLVMSIEHRELPVFGVQFHPESILATQGHLLLSNFLKLAGITHSAKIPPGDFPTSERGEPDFYDRTFDPDAVRPL